MYIFPVYGFGCELESLQEHCQRSLMIMAMKMDGEGAILLPVLGFLCWNKLEFPWQQLRYCFDSQISWSEEDAHHVVLIVLQLWQLSEMTFHHMWIFLTHLFNLTLEVPVCRNSQRWGLLLTVWSGLVEHARFPPAEHITQAYEPRLLQTCWIWLQQQAD